MDQTQVHNEKKEIRKTLKLISSLLDQSNSETITEAKDLINALKQTILEKL